MSANRQSSSNRVLSVDVLRGLTILLMVFVNDLGPAAPSWMLHIQPPDADGMTLADIVFPAFLFIVGVSIPLAFESARSRGKSTALLLLHILIRSFTLIVLGLIGYNRANDQSLGHPWWGLLAYIAVILGWTVPPQDSGTKRTVFIGLKALGAAGLLTLLILFRRSPTETELFGHGPVSGWVWLQTGWWGILGLIGWSYLIVSLLYLCLGRRREWLMMAMLLLVMMGPIMSHGGFFTRLGDKAWIDPDWFVFHWLTAAVSEVNEFVQLGSVLGTLPSVTMAGCLLGTVLLPAGDIVRPRERIGWGLMFAAGLFVAGTMLDTFAGVNKIAATPTWCLWCSSITCLVWILLYVMIDLQGWNAPANAVKPVGENPLLAYFLHPIILWSLQLAGLSGRVRGYASSDEPAVVIAGSLTMAIFVCLMTAVLARIGFRLKI